MDASQSESVAPTAARVIAKFGGPRRLSLALAAVGYEIDRRSIYKWMWSIERGGTGGLIPTASIRPVVLAARLQGILLTAEDVAPW